MSLTELSKKFLLLSADIRINVGGEAHNKPQAANKSGCQSLLDKKGGVLHIQIEAGEVRIVHSEEVFFNILAKCGKLDFISTRM